MAGAGANPTHSPGFSNSHDSGRLATVVRARALTAGYVSGAGLSPLVMPFSFPNGAAARWHQLGQEPRGRTVATTSIAFWLSPCLDRSLYGTTTRSLR
jgi:hypothetical protein